MRKLILLVGACLLSANPLFKLSAQTPSGIWVKGTVTDSYGQALPGVIISAKDGKVIGTTDINGDFTFVSTKGENISFSLTGYKHTTQAVKEDLTVVMQESIHNLDETVYLGHTTQKRVTFAGAVSTTGEKELGKSLYSRLQGTLIGRLSGLTTMETSGQPASENVQLYVRGYSTMHGTDAGIVIDGIYYDTYSNDLLYRISPMDIESVSILKDGASQALYGIQGARGIIVITTKRGMKGKARIDVQVDEIMQQATTKPMFINSATYATLRNQAAANDGLGPNYYFTDEQIEKFRAGNDPLYPSNNWREMLTRKMSHMQRAGVSVSGGSEHVQYYTNVNLQHQGGLWHTDQTKYNANNDFVKVNVRANVDVQLNSYISGYLNMAGNIVRRHDPFGNTQSGNEQIYNALFTAPPTLYGPTTPIEYDEFGNMTETSDQVTVTERMSQSPYGMLNRSGYYTQTNTNIYSQFGLKLDLSFLTQGLSLSGKVGYLAYSTASMGTTQQYARYRRTDNWDELKFVQQGTTENTELAYSKGVALYSYLSYQGAVNYARNFGRHHLKGMAFAIYQGFTRNSNTYDYNRFTSGVDLQYDYDDRYAVTFDLGYSGSDQFTKEHRFMTTPGVSVAYILSNESFVKDHAPWLSLLKPRFSYALTGNDVLGLGRYAYDDRMTFGKGGSVGYLQYITREDSYGNAALEAEKIRKMNVGVDIGLFDALTLSVDVFKDKTTNGVARSTEEVPSYQGIDLGKFPSTNLAQYENKGYEVELDFRKRLNKDWEMSLGGFVAYNENKMIYSGETSKGEGYVYPYRSQGFAYGQQFGYLVDYSNGNGMFNFQSDIDNSGLTYSFGTPRVGDLIYQDLNGDKVIDEKDQAPIGHGTLPSYYYGISGGFTYKNFELSFLLQGVGKYETLASGMGVYETSNEGVFGENHLKAWTQERWNNNEEILYPALSTTTSTNHKGSDFFLYDRSYLRLRNLEMSYTLPAHISRLVSAKNIKVVLTGQNLFTISHMKSADFGPEGSYNTYPVYRMYSIGVKAQF